VLWRGDDVRDLDSPFPKCVVSKLAGFKATSSALARMRASCRGTRSLSIDGCVEDVEHVFIDFICAILNMI